MLIRAGVAAFAILTGIEMELATARAQQYPARPIRVIAASSPGGISDVFMRAAGEDLHKRLGQPIIVENRSGGAFNIATKACTEAVPDGYTFCILPNEPVTYNLFLFKNVGFDPDKGLAAVTNLFFMTQTLAVSSALNVNSLSELAGASKARPATLSYSSPAHAQALFVERFKQETGADLVRVPFKGGGDAVNGMLSGTTPVVFIALGNVIAHVRAGTVRALLVDGDRRSPLVPDTPTLLEHGYRGDVTRSYFGLFAPAGTPPSAIAKVRDAIAEVVAVPTFMDRQLVQRGLEPAIGSPEAFAAFIKQDRAAAERVVKAAGLEAQ
jgi:tripartite-type tricarboxylate transporter receptor subunit TctC